MILAERQSASSLCWHAAGRGCRHCAGVPDQPGGQSLCPERLSPASRLPSQTHP